MNNSQFVEEIANLYGYDEELKTAIGLAIPLMINHYGTSRSEEVYDLFRNVRIFAERDMSRANRDRIEKEMIGNKNNHILEQEEDLYQNDRAPGSYYSYEAIFDDNMNVIDESRWVVVSDTKDTYQADGYKNLFGTTINMPYFIHEMGHAFGMQKATYRKDGNKIYSKHGMFEQVITYEEKDGKTTINSQSLNDIMMEEAINELDAQKMLQELLQVDSYDAVRTQLSSINHVNTSYNSVIVSLAEKLQNVLGKEQLLKLRSDNDKSILEEFNRVASESDIAKKYCNDIEPYTVLDKKCFALFLLKSNCYKMSMEEYNYKTKELMVEAYAPLCAYQDKKYGTMSPEKFDNIRAGILGIQMEQTLQKEEQDKVR